MIQIHKMLVTPEMARDWLANQAVNRTIIWGWVHFLCSEMKAGDWLSDGVECISFNVDNKLIDGQHRLLALLEFGEPICMAVALGVTDYLGLQKPRTLPDILQIRKGEKFTNDQVATIKVFVGDPHIAPLTLSRTYKRYRSAIDFAIECLRPKREFVSNSNVAAAVARAYYRESHTRLREFGKVLTSEVSHGDDDIAAIRLMRQLRRGPPPVPAFDI